MSEAITNAGKLLKSTRESMGLSLSDVSTATKISQKVLSALENGKMEDLPAKSFARGFARTYAIYLKIDPQPVIEAYQLDDKFITNQGRPEFDPTGNPVAAETEKKNSSSGISLDWSSRFFLIVSILVLVGLIIGVKSLVDKYAKERDVPAEVQTESGTAVITNPGAETPETELTGDQDSPEDTTALAAAPTTTITATVNATVTSAPTAQPASPTPTPKAKPSPTPQPSPTAKPSPKPTLTPTVAAAIVSPSPTPKTETKQVGKVEEILLEALDKVEIEVSLDGATKQKLSLDSGTIKAYKYSKSIEMSISDGGLINIIRNGQDMGNAGDLGRSVKLKYP